MEVRDFTVADQAATRALIQAGLRERWGPTFDPDANPDTDDLWASYVATGGDVVVAVSQAQVVGTGSLVALAGDSGQLVRIATDSGHRRKGIARTIVADLIRRARARGFRRLVVTTDTPWRSAVALYLSCGFQIEAADNEVTRFRLRLDHDRGPSDDLAPATHGSPAARYPSDSPSSSEASAPATRFARVSSRLAAYNE